MASFIQKGIKGLSDIGKPRERFGGDVLEVLPVLNVRVDGKLVLELAFVCT
jgi:hypothetical protein